MTEQHHWAGDTVFVVTFLTEEVNWEEGISRPGSRRIDAISALCQSVGVPCQWSCAHLSMSPCVLGKHVLGFQEAVRRVACFPDFLPLFSAPLNHVSARTSHCVTENGSIPIALIPYRLPRKGAQPYSHSAVGRIALWSFHCLKVVDK